MMLRAKDKPSATAVADLLSPADTDSASVLTMAVISALSLAAIVTSPALPPLPAVTRSIADR